jgi:integrase/recombinase XerD
VNQRPNGTFISSRSSFVSSMRAAPVLTASQVTAILHSIDVSTFLGLRDRALIGILNFALARVSAAVSVRLRDYRFCADSRNWVLTLTEKGRTPRNIAVHPTLREYLDQYIEQVVRPTYGEHEDTLLFRSSVKSAASEPISRFEAWSMIRLRGAAIGIEVDPYWVSP